MENDKDHCRISRWELLKKKLTNYDPVAFKKAIESERDFVLIDCRRKEEFNTGYLAGALNLDYLSYEFLDELEKLDEGGTYFVYCRSGRRSLRTCTLMQNSGFKNVINLDGGLNAWEEKIGQAPLILSDKNSR
ncbi:MAG: rhodanese-like domain-containing protein [Bacteroidetes bacterium]|nr:rhodanese-like domain-containing protein [Bacteroidota bacterium]